MKFFLVIIICFTIFSCNQSQEKKENIFNKQEKESVELLANSSFEILSETNTYDQFNVIDKNETLVFIYTFEGVTFIDEVDYETDYTECLIFEFNVNEESFNFTNEEITKLNCVYQWRAEANTLKKETKKITDGTISGEKIDDETWRINVNIDTKFSFGGYFEKGKTRKISIDKDIKTTKR